MARQTRNPRLLAQMREMGADGPTSVPPDHYFDYVAEFANIPAAGQATVTVKIDSAGHFIVDQLNGSFQLNGAFGAAIDGSPLSRDGNPLIANNTMPTLAHVRIAISSTDRQWHGGATAIRADTILGDARQPGWLAWKAAVQGGDSMQVTVFNDGPAPIKGQVVFAGHKMLYAAE